MMGRDANTFGQRLSRLARHMLWPVYRQKPNDFPPGGILEWVWDTLFYTMDVAGIPEMYMGLNRLMKTGVRPLSEQEIRLGRRIFGDAIDYSRVRVDESARIGTRRLALAYVSFNLINYRRKINKAIFVHELMHIWQYQKFGSIYLARAIKAQRSKEGYDYGGVEYLYQAMNRGMSLLEFNFEQQADIVEDYYRLLKNASAAGPMVLSIYGYFANQVREDHC